MSSVAPRDRSEPDDKDLDKRYKKLNLTYPKFHNLSPCECEEENGKPKTRSPTTVHQSTNANNKSTEAAEFGYLTTRARFAHIDLESDVYKARKLLLELWEMPQPELIMSIIGGTKHFRSNEQLESVLIKEIINVALKSNAWIITNGYKIGITQLIGEGIQKARLKKQETQLIAIGIPKWRSIKNIETIITKTNRRKTMNNKREPNTSNEDEKDDEKMKSGGCYLEMHHSHYLILDDGKCCNFSTGDFRTRLCHQISISGENKEFRIPLVTIVAEGGRETLSNVYYDLKNRIPVVIINGSGRIADFLSRWLLITKNLEKNSKDTYAEYGVDEFGTGDVTNVQNISSTANDGRLKVHVKLHARSNQRRLREIFKKHEKSMENDLRDLFEVDEMSNKKSKDSQAKHQSDDEDSASKDEDQSNDEDLTSEDENQSNNEDLISQAVIYVMYCLQPSVRSRIKVFNSDGTESLSAAIFASICNSQLQDIEREKKYKGTIAQWAANSNSPEDVDVSSLLTFAMDWDCIQVAKELILKESLENITVENRKKHFKTALKENLPAFVNEFIRLGLDPADVFFNSETYKKDGLYKTFIEELYSNIENSDQHHFEHFIDKDKKQRVKHIKTCSDLNTVLREIIGDHMHHLYFDSEEDEVDHISKWGLNNVCYSKSHKNQDIESVKSLSPAQLKSKRHKYIMRDLFLWAVLMNYIDMAKIFLAYLKYRICPALIATKIFKKYYSVAVYGELKDAYKKNFEYFEQYAINCLDECNIRDAELACQLVVQQNDLYGYVTCLQVASDAKDKLFLGRPPCVQVMRNIWYDKLHPKTDTNLDKIFMALGVLTFGLSAPTSVSYRGDDNDNDHNHDHEHITYLFFLLLFSYVLLFQFSPPKNQTPSIHWTEILTIILVSSMLIEEFHFFFTEDNVTFRGKLQNSCRDVFKILNMAAFTLFYIGLIVRFSSANSETDFVAARVVMAIDLELWWLRCLSFIIVIPFLGPHLVAITKMLKDLGFFLLILAVVIIGYGVAAASMVYYPKANNFTTETGGTKDTSFSGRAVLRNIFYPVYYLLYSQVSGPLKDLDSNPDAGWSIATHVLLAIHMIFVNILLLNLLIAMFSKRFEEVYDDTTNIWHSQQYLFTREYFARSVFMPPINVIFDVYYLVRMIFFYIKRKYFNGIGNPSTKRFKIIAVEKDLIENWRDFEGASSYKYAQSEIKALKYGSAKVLKELGTTIDEDTVEKTDTSQNDTEKTSALYHLKADLSVLSTTVSHMQIGFKKFSRELEKRRPRRPGN